MKVSYTNTFSDLLAFHLHYYLRSWSVYLVYGGIFAIGCKDAVASAIAAHFSTESSIHLASTIIANLIVIGGVLFILTAVSLLSSKNRIALRQHTISLTPVLVIEESPVNRTETKWAGVEKVLKTRHHLFVFVGKNLAHIIPKRAFGTEGDWDSFHKFCLEHSAV